MTPPPPQLYEKCLGRYPLMNRVEVVRGGTVERPPDFLAAMLAILECGSHEPLCIMLPFKGDIARIAAVMLGLSRFWRTYEERLFRFAESALTVGGRVGVRPLGDVFEYRGLWGDDYPDQFRLRTLPRAGQNPADLSFPLAQLLRLEPTIRSSPRGGPASFSALPPVPIDEVLAIKTYGNRAIFSNEVLLADAKESFLSFAGATGLRRSDLDGAATYPLAEVAAIGEVRQKDNGSVELCRLGEDSRSGAPLVAVSYSTEALAKHCLLMPTHSSLVVFNGASRASNLQDFDDICQVQRVVVFADRGEQAATEMLLKRGCRLWDFYSGPLQTIVGAGSVSDGGIFSSIVSRASNATSLTLKSRACTCDALDEAVRCLVSVSHQATEDPQSAASRTVKSLWGFANYLAALVGDLDAPARATVAARADEIGRSARAAALWLPESVRVSIEETLEWIKSALEPGSGLGSSKKDALFAFLAHAASANRRAILITRPECIQSLSHLLGQSGYEAPICTPHSVPVDELFDEVICMSWPGGDAAAQIVSTFAASTVSLLAYLFEARWLDQYQGRQRRHKFQSALTSSEKQGLLAPIFGNDISWPPDPRVDTEPAMADDPWPEASVIEHRLKGVRKGNAVVAAAGELTPARYLGFCGTRYAYLTPNHRVPVATDLLRTQSSASAELPERVIENLRVGDFIVFPDSGDKELLYTLADKMLGRKATRLRGLAASWRRTLQASSMTPETFHRHAIELKEPRHLTTIRNWFSDERQIGPRSRNDLVLIGLVTGDKLLDQDAERIWNAISELRGAHLSAGMRLRDVLMHKLPTVLHNVEQNGTRVELEDLGAAWIVQIEAIASEVEERARNEINRLLIDSTALLEELL